RLKDVHIRIAERELALEHGRRRLQGPVLDEKPGKSIGWRKSLVGDAAENYSSLFSEIGERRRIGERARQRLFDECRHTRSYRLAGNRNVLVVRRQYHHQIGSLLRKEIIEETESRGAV